MAKYTWQSYMEDHRGFHGIIAVVAVAMVIFQVYTGLFGSLDALKQRAIHLAFGLILVFLVYPFSRRKAPHARPGWPDFIFILASIAFIAYPLLNYDWITAERFSLISPLSMAEKFFAILAVVLVLEATRRVVGSNLVLVVVVFLVYPFIGPYLPGLLKTSTISWSDLLDFQYLGTSGIFGIPLGVSANEIAIFIIFGSVLIRSGGAELMNNVAVAIAGRSPGGPAKVAVVGSSLMGTISGSGTANVVTTGSVTIPMMKKVGFQPHFAGAVEAVASTGGQIMPPVMGAAAFVVSSFSGIPYAQLMIYAILPAILYFAGLFITVHLEALRLKLPGMEPETSLKDTLRDYGHMFIPIAFLVCLLLSGYTPRLAGSMAVLAALAASQLRSTTRMSMAEILAAFENGAKGMLIVVTATAAAGLIIGVIDLTGLGQRLGAGFISLSGGYLLPALILGALLAIILGMGMPTTAAYIIQAATVVPALIQIGLMPVTAHLFAFYFACLSLITPPVAISAYAAAGIAQSNIWQTGWTAFRLGMAGYIVPFMFVYGPSLLLIGQLSSILISTVTAFVGIFFLAVSIQGYFMRSLDWLQRLIAFVTALLLIAPSTMTVIPGLILGLVLTVRNVYQNRRTKSSESKVNAQVDNIISD